MSLEMDYVPKKKFVNTLEDLPLTECWVIVKDEAVHYEGDERSRTHPGHGYPEHTDRFVKVYEVYGNEEEFKTALGRAAETKQFGGYPVRGFKLIPYTTKTTVEVVRA